MDITHTSFTKILQRDYGDVFVRLISNKNFNDLLIEIDSISELSSEYGYSDSEIEEETKLGKYKFIGDLFEIFAEAFFIQFSSDNRIGVFDYSPVLSDDDNGVDGFGKNINGYPCTVQVKYRGNPTYELKERDIKQFAYQSVINYNVDYRKSGDMIVFTNCKGLHWYTDSKVFDGKIRCINGDIISKIIDNNEGFWQTFENLIIESVRSVGVDKLTELFISKLNDKNKI